MGLEKEYWGKVLGALSEIIPIYDKVNFYISFGKDQWCRVNGIDGNVKCGDDILDMGSGFGNMSKTAVTMVSNVNITLFDPLLPMLKRSSMYFYNTPKICGIFEYMPIQNEKFDVVLCGYSLRDALNINTTISEVHRILKKNGKWVIVDLGKPDNVVIRTGIMFYLYMLLPIIALIIGGKTGIRFRMIYGTYKKWLTNKTLVSLLKKKFSKVIFNKILIGGSIMITAYK